MTGNAVLPDALIEVDLRSLAVGQTVWTVPWIMWVDAGRRCWIDPRFTPCAEPGGTVDTKVTRLSDGWRVDVTRSTHRWRPGGHISAGDPYEPVRELEWSPFDG